MERIHSKPHDSLLFDQDFLSRLEGLALLARQLARSRQRADRRSSQRGASVEFAEYRSFQSGDDWRYIDWNAYARWRTLVLKLFTEELDLPVWLVLDGTESMRFGQPSKLDHTRRLAAGLAYIALSSHDRVGIVTLDQARPNILPPARGKQNFPNILRFLSQMRTHVPQHSLETLLQHWLLTRPQRGMIVWISDLWGHNLNDAENAIHRLRYSRSEVSIIQVTDPAESDAGNTGEYQLQGMEGESPRTVVVDRQTRRRYQELYTAYHQQIQMTCRKHQLPLLPANTHTDCLEILTRALQEKGFVQ